MDIEEGSEMEEGPIQIESLCMGCSENGTTSILTRSIPHFRDVVIMAFECPHCGLRNNELQPVKTCEEKGVVLKLNVPPECADVLSRQIVKSGSATIRIPELDFEMPGGSQRGMLTTIEGLVKQAAGDLLALQEDRRKVDPETASKIDAFCSKLEACANGKQPFSLEVNDPSGNSFIESPNVLSKDDLLHQTHYTRTVEQNRMLGLVVQDEGDEVTEGTEARGFALSQSAISAATGNAFIHQYSAPDEVMVFPGRCLMCHKETETRMYPTRIPYFKDVIIMANSCDSCGYKNSEVRPGGGISEKGRIIKLEVSSKEDLDRDVIKSDSAIIEIPSLQLTVQSGTGMITTVEGLVRRIVSEIRLTSGFQLGDSADEKDKEKYEKFFAEMEELLECKKAWNLVLKDPLSNSFVMPLRDKIEDDVKLAMEDYERTASENQQFGIDALQIMGHQE